jgi:hypothetical protein
VHSRPRQLRLRLALIALSGVVLTGCGRWTDEPPTGGATASSVLTNSSDGAAKVDRWACKLLTAEDRQALAGKSMNIVVPVAASAGTKECQWVHALNESSNSTIRLVAFSTQEWAKTAPGQLRSAMRNPRLTAYRVKRLQAATKLLARGPSKLSTRQVCDIYWELARANGFKRGSQVVFSSMIGRMRAAYAAGCGKGVLTLLGYGEYGLVTSIPLYEAVIETRKKAHIKAVELLLAEHTDGDEDEATSSPTQSATPTPTPSATRSAGPSDAPTSDSPTSDSSE